MTERQLTQQEFSEAMDIARHHCESEDAAHGTGYGYSGGGDYESFTDNVHPDAFAEALDAFPDCAAADISDAIYAGISRYWDTREI